jgi:uncharacterized ferredoxin-like protein
MMLIVINKDTKKVVYKTNQKSINLLSIYHINLKRNYPTTKTTDYYIKEIIDEDDIKKIKSSHEVFIGEDGNFQFIQHPESINREKKISKQEQLECRVSKLETELIELKNILKGS